MLVGESGFWCLAEDACYFWNTQEKLKNSTDNGALTSDEHVRLKILIMLMYVLYFTKHKIYCAHFLKVHGLVSNYNLNI